MEMKSRHNKPIRIRNDSSAAHLSFVGRDAGALRALAKCQALC